MLRAKYNLQSERTFETPCSYTKFAFNFQFEKSLIKYVFLYYLFLLKFNG